MSECDGSCSSLDSFAPSKSHREVERGLDKMLLSFRSFSDLFNSQVWRAQYRLTMANVEDNYPRVAGLLNRIGLPPGYKGTYQ